MKRWKIPLLVLLSLSACHHKEERQAPSDTTYPIPAAATAADSLNNEAVTDSTYTILHNTATPVDSRIFRRNETVVYKPEQLLGEWRRGGEHEEYKADGSGLRWHTGEDVKREEAQPFTWRLEDNILQVRYPLSVGGVVIRQYEVTFVDDETLVYRDRYGEAYLWDKEL